MDQILCGLTSVKVSGFNVIKDLARTQLQGKH